MVESSKWRARLGVARFFASHLVDTGARRRGGRQTVDYAMEAFLEGGVAEVDQQADLEVHQTQIGQELLRMNGCEALDRLELHDDAFIDDEIGAEAFFKEKPVVFDPHWALPLHSEPAPFKFAGQHEFID